MGEGEGVVSNSQLMVAECRGELRGEPGEVGVNVVGEMIVKGSSSGM